MKSKSIAALLVDDDRDLQATMVSLASDIGLDLTVASSSDEARLIFASFSPRLVIAEYNLGQDNGFDLLAEFKDLHPDVRTILISGDENCLMQADESEAVDQTLSKRDEIRTSKALLDEIAKAGKPEKAVKAGKFRR